MPYRVVQGILTEDQEAELNRRYGINRPKAPPVVAAPSTPPVAKPKFRSAPPAATTKSGARFRWKYYASWDRFNTMVIPSDSKPDPKWSALFTRHRDRFVKALAALNRIGLKPDAFLVYDPEYTSDEPTMICVAPRDQNESPPFWPMVGEYADETGGYRPIGAGRFTGTETAEQLAMFACRLCREENCFFLFVPETFEGLTQDEIDAICLALFDGVRVTFPESEVVEA
jgi:hypothetical protein